VFVTVELLEQLRHLTADPDRADALAAALSGLCIDVGVTVPSWVSVSIVLASSTDADMEVAIVAPSRRGRVLSSLAVPLSELDPGDQLVVRAGGAGAFLLLAEDLASRLGGDREIVVDRHLDLPGSGEAAAGMFAGLGVVDQAIGVLLDRGLSPREARRDLERRARASGLSVAAAARSLLETVSGAGDPGGDGQ
jgi:hypothetical protein